MLPARRAPGRARQLALTASLLLLLRVRADIIGSVTLLVVKGDERMGQYREQMRALQHYSALNDLPEVSGSNSRQGSRRTGTFALWPHRFAALNAVQWASSLSCRSCGRLRSWLSAHFAASLLCSGTCAADARCCADRTPG